MGKLMPIVRVVLAGGITGPDMVSFMTIIGKEEVKKRIQSIKLKEKV
jgi:glutamyl/glutaminyl-tRNA synthetase